MKTEEVKKIETYLRRVFGSNSIGIRSRPRKDDSAEVYIGDEFIGIIFKDDEDGEVSYNFTMAILELDLES